MGLSISKTQSGKKNKGGRPRTDAKPVMLRLSLSDLGAVDRWRSADISRPEAIRRLLRSHPELKRYLGGGKTES